MPVQQGTRTSTPCGECWVGPAATTLAGVPLPGVPRLLYTWEFPRSVGNKDQSGNAALTHLSADSTRAPILGCSHSAILSHGVAGLLQVHAGSSMVAGLGPPCLRMPGHQPQRGAWTTGSGRRGRRAGRAACSGWAAAPRGSAVRTAAQREPTTHRQEAGAWRRLTLNIS